MRCRTGFAACLVLIQAAACVAQQPAWRPSLADARAVAAETGLPILIHFTGRNCVHCVVMDREVFSDPGVQRSLRSNVAAVMANRDVDVALAAEFGVRRVPADVILYPDGQRSFHEGRQGRDQYLQFLTQVGQRRRRPPRRPEDSDKRPVTQDQPRLAKTDTGSVSGTAQGAAGVTGNSADEAVNSDVPGLEGYCPVLLRLEGKLQAGEPAISTVHQGVRYRFSSEERRRQFLADPAKFAPHGFGCDPVILTKEHRAVAGDVRLRLWFDGRLYLFTSEKSQQEFRRQPLSYSRMRSAVRVEDIQRTRLN